MGAARLTVVDLKKLVSGCVERGVVSRTGHTAKLRELRADRKIELDVEWMESRANKYYRIGLAALLITGISFVISAWAAAF